MKTQTARLKYLHIAPRKVRLVASSLKGLSVNEAEAQLLMTSKRPNMALLKLLHSAIANAKHNSQLDAGKLFIKEIRVDAGPMLKRNLPRAMGRATPLQKKSSHITLVLAESEKLKAPRFRMEKPKKVSKRIKLEKMKKKTETEKQKSPEKETVKKTEKPSLMRRIFRRKSI